MEIKMKNKNALSLAGIIIYGFLFLCGCSQTKIPATKEAKITAVQATELGTEAYIYGYPLVTMDMTKRIMTNVETQVGTRSPMGQFVRMRSYPDASFRDVTAPNADTLYTTAWIDVKKEPWVLTIPDAKNRYYLFPMLDGWTNVFQVPGKRTSGTGAQKYAITGPGWQGKLPAGVKEFKAPTSLVWILGRIYCTGTPEDYAAVHKLQDKISIVPLSSYGKPYAAPKGQIDTSVDMKTAVREQVNSLDISTYFNRLAALMLDNPPAAEDRAMVEKLALLGIVAGLPFDLGKLNSEAANALKELPKSANEKIMSHYKDAGKNENGWIFTTNTGVYGTDYLERAFITAIGLGANRPQDAVYPSSHTDSNGQPYDGSKKYVMHFDKGRLPNTKGFWSLTMYDAGYFFVNNPLNRYSISARQNLKHNTDGSVDLYIQNTSPGKDLESNWLPAPAGQFQLMLRMYWPSEKDPSILDGTWTIPAVKQIG